MTTLRQDSSLAAPTRGLNTEEEKQDRLKRQIAELDRRLGQGSEWKERAEAIEKELLLPLIAEAGPDAMMKLIKSLWSVREDRSRYFSRKLVLSVENRLSELSTRFSVPGLVRLVVFLSKMTRKDPNLTLWRALLEEIGKQSGELSSQQLADIMLSLTRVDCTQLKPSQHFLEQMEQHFLNLEYYDRAALDHALLAFARFSDIFKFSQALWHKLWTEITFRSGSLSMINITNCLLACRHAPDYQVPVKSLREMEKRAYSLLQHSKVRELLILLNAFTAFDHYPISDQLLQALQSHFLQLNADLSAEQLIILGSSFKALPHHLKLLPAMQDYCEQQLKRVIESESVPPHKMTPLLSSCSHLTRDPTLLAKLLDQGSQKISTFTPQMLCDYVARLTKGSTLGGSGATQQQKKEQNQAILQEVVRHGEAMINEFDPLIGLPLFLKNLNNCCTALDYKLPSSFTTAVQARLLAEATTLPVRTVTNCLGTLLNFPQVEVDQAWWEAFERTAIVPILSDVNSWDWVQILSASGKLMLNFNIQPSEALRSRIEPLTDQFLDDFPAEAALRVLVALKRLLKCFRPSAKLVTRLERYVVRLLQDPKLPQSQVLQLSVNLRSFLVNSPPSDELVESLRNFLQRSDMQRLPHSDLASLLSILSRKPRIVPSLDFFQAAEKAILFHISRFDELSRTQLISFFNAFAAHYTPANRTLQDLKRRDKKK